MLLNKRDWIFKKLKNTKLSMKNSISIKRNPVPVFILMILTVFFMVESVQDIGCSVSTSTL
jgi:hypothetical protein